MFRNCISAKPGAQFPPEKDRYHIYVSYACPWAHRVLLTRYLKGLTTLIDISVVDAWMNDKGWTFSTKDEVADKSLQTGTGDQLYGFLRLSQLYFKAQPDYEGRFTVPVLWDKKLETIINNESSEIIRMLNTEFNGLLEEKYAQVDIYPRELRSQIDELNGWIYENINNGVYKTGFATKQEVYNEEVVNVFEHLDKLESLLRENQRRDPNNKFLTGPAITEADIRLYTTIVRFDPVYHQHFKLNIRMIRHDYPFIHDWLRLLYWKIPGFKETTFFEHIKCHYTKSHVGINPNKITPMGPLPNIMPL